MKPIYPRVIDAVDRYARKLAETESTRGELDQVRLKVGVVLFRDRCDGDKMIEDSGGFFDISTSIGLGRFRTYMAEAAMRCGGGGDRPEQAYEAIRHMATKYFHKTGDSYHLPGAATIGIVISDNGSHAKEDPKSTEDHGTDLSTEMVKQLLEATDKDGQFPRVMLNTIFARTGNRTDALWDSQMPGLSTASRGISTSMDFVGDAAGEVPRNARRSAREDHRRRRRERAARERSGFASLYTRTDDGTPVLDLDARTPARPVRRNLHAARAQGNAKADGQHRLQLPVHPGQGRRRSRSRWQPRVLLTKSEVLRPLVHLSRARRRAARMHSPPRATSSQVPMLTTS